MDSVSLKWNNHYSSLINSLDHFKAVDSFVDVTLICEGQTVKAHKIILSAGSNMLRRLLLANPAKHPIIILAETKYEHLRIIIDFLYKGRINVSRSDLNKVLQIAKAFEINDLKKICEESLNSIKIDKEQSSHACLKSPDLSGCVPEKKRQRRQSSGSDTLIDDTLPKTEINFSPCRFNQSEVSTFTDTSSLTVQTKLAEFNPQIANARSLSESPVELCTVRDSTIACDKENHKGTFTECDIQPIKEVKHSISVLKPRVIIQPRCNEITDDSESDSQNKVEVLSKRKRSTIWHYFTVLNERYAVCKICHSKLSYKTTVTNLTKHLVKRHKRFDPKHPPKLPEVPLIRIQNEQLEIFEEIDFNSTEDQSNIQDTDEHLPYDEALNEDNPSTSTPCILKIT